MALGDLGQSGTKCGTTTHTISKRYKKDRYLSLMKGLADQGFTVREIAKKLNISKSKAHRDLMKVCPKKTNPGVMGQAPEFEIHDYQVVSKILEKPAGWKPQTILHFKKVKYRVEDQHGWEKQIFEFGSCSVHLTPYNVLIWPHKLTSKVDIYDVKARMDQIAIKTIERLEKLLELKLSNNTITYWDVTKQHAVMKQEKIWDVLWNQGFREIKNQDGKIMLYLDRSNGEKHIESQDQIYADNNINKFERLIAETLTGDFSLKDIQNAVLTNQKAILEMKGIKNNNEVTIPTKLQNIPKENPSPEEPADYIG